jgi:IS5 family transposase
MLRPCLLQCWYDLSDVATEEAVYDSRAMSRFVGVDFSGGSQVSDSTTLREFRKCITDNGLGELMLGSLNAILEESGVMMRGGSIVDAAFVEAPSSTKNAPPGRATMRRVVRYHGRASFFMTSSVSQYLSKSSTGMRTLLPTLIAGRSPDLISCQILTREAKPISTRSLIV